jgi:hypothetical protein
MANHDTRIFIAGWIAGILALAILGYSIDAPDGPVASPFAHAITTAQGAGQG